MMINDTKVDNWGDTRRMGVANFFSSVTNSKPFVSAIGDHGENCGSNKHGRNCRGNTGPACYHARLRNSKCAPEIRVINPAIYAESVDDEDEKIEVRIRVQRKTDDNLHKHCVGAVEDSCSNCVAPSERLSNLSIKSDNAGLTDERIVVPETYRCASSISANDSSSYTSMSNVPVERRCKMNDDSNRDNSASKQDDQSGIVRYMVDGQRVVYISSTTLSNTVADYQHLEGVELARKLAYDEWMRRKQSEAKRRKEAEERAASRRRAREEKLAREREEKERRDRENFLRWVERKRREEESKRAELERELELQERLKSVEDKAAVAKTLCLLQWARKKDEEQKEQQRRERLKQMRKEEERKKRIEESTKAYEKWREMSKNRPKPATQGLLPHQKAKPSYVNPQPWQPLLEYDPEETDQYTSDNRNSEINQSNQGARKILMSH